MNERQPVFEVGPDEKVASIMAYTSTQLCWGEVVIKNQIRPSTWIRTNLAPEIIQMYNARILMTTGFTDQPKPLSYPEIHLSTENVIAFHLIPPAKDPIDYDPTEPNRRMEPVSVVVGSFTINGFMRMSTVSSLAKYLEITRENFSSVYDADIRSLMIPALGIIRVPYLLVRQNAVIFTTRTI